ncbi:LpqB family beta-propeller domain-containing protein [Occultella kanbiaonis]|uniref:LpqB family beta-propeller domain-containing protein n=1 Tax=Occultella kanbiaonis TaxID=2675754 RepID=UPI0012B8AF9E|nr:LpqB family beta-propeller domain-containing protein [Occultella kanbiaonis]
MNPNAGITGKARAAVVLIALAVIAGCASLPTDGAVQRGVEAAPDTSGIVLSAEDPRPDASPSEIVRGFLAGSAGGLVDNFAVARKFLTTEGSDQWDPAGGVVIYSGSAALEVVEGEAGVVEVRVTVAGTVDPTGVRTEARPGTETTQEFRLTQDADAQWRIESLPDGVLISDVNFGSQYRGTPLYFLSPDATMLVPDMRFYPARNTATYAMNGLLGGPVEWLSTGVISAIPSGTSLTLDTVPVSAGTATVDVTEEISGAGSTDRARLQAQIQATLTALPQVQDVEILVDSRPFNTSDVDLDLTLNPGVGTSPTMLSGDALVRFNGSTLSAAPNTAPLTGIDASDPALPYGDDLAVALADDRFLITVPTPDTASVTLLEGTALLDPSFDRFGWVWTGERTNTGRLLLARTDGSTATLETPTLAGAQVASIRVSRDGTRMAVVYTGGGAMRVEVVAITRDADGVPIRLGPPLSLAPSMTSATQVVWVDESTLAVLGASGGSISVHLVTVGGQPTRSLPTVVDSASIAAARGERELYLVTSDGNLYARSGNGWRPVSGLDPVRDPTFPG